jgi:hypothetical protein
VPKFCRGFKADNTGGLEKFGCPPPNPPTSKGPDDGFPVLLIT